MSDTRFRRLFYLRVIVRRFYDSTQEIFIERALAASEGEAVSQVRERPAYRNAVSVTVMKLPPPSQER